MAQEIEFSQIWRKFGPNCEICPVKIEVFNSAYEKTGNYCWYNRHNDKNHSLETNMEERLSLLTLITDTDLNLNSLNAGFSQLL